MDNDTITAIATAAGKGGIGIVRLSGPKSLAIAAQLTQTDLSPRHALFS
ncbi:MAG TPA: tRNA uridine-5-carboxymethylaminomethyl(34) synthesis GTPase MnmE, partial [Cellvibrionales bacterium]|nr:tRNA uridine-5-carboxymethylaminomethyl(34) synthesis GTPase MnmE [Cellvibrionales bacterium]